jgi:hypothetical protein
MRSTARVAVEALDVTPSWTLDCAPGALFLCMRHAKGDSPRQATPGNGRSTWPRPAMRSRSLGRAQQAAQQRPYHSPKSMLTRHINRGGDTLPRGHKKHLEEAKDKLRRQAGAREEVAECPGRWPT